MATAIEITVEERSSQERAVEYLRVNDASITDDEKISKAELMGLVERSGFKSSAVKKSPLKLSLSEPSSPNKLYRAMKATYKNDDYEDDLSSTGSSTTITSEDGLNGSRDLHQSDTVRYNEQESTSSLRATDELDSPAVEYRQRAGTGSKFYHETFNSTSTASLRPSLYIPTNHIAQQYVFDGKPKKQKGLLNRLRHSFNKHKPIVGDRVQQKSAKQRKWIDHEDELDPVSRPSYFRHIGHVIKTGPGPLQTIQLNRPPQGKFGIYIAQGVDPDSNARSVFVSRFYEESMSIFYGSLIQPGDEIIAINGRLVRDVPVATITKLLTGLETVQLTMLPRNLFKT